MTEKLLAILFSVLILVQAGIIRRLVGTWIFPACLFGIFWFLFTFIPLLALFTVPIEPYAVAFILLCCVIFSATSLTFNWKSAFRLNQRKEFRPIYSRDFIRRTFYGLTLLAIMCILGNTIAQGFSLSKILFNLMETSSEYTNKRYSDELTTNLLSQLILILTYPAAILGGMVYANRDDNKKGRLTLLLAMIPSLLIMIIQGAKGAIFLSITFFWGGLLAKKIEANNLALLTKKGVYRLIIYGSLLFPLVVVSFLSRGLYDENNTKYVFDSLVRYFASYSSAHLYAFSDWFSHFISGKSVMRYFDDSNGYGFYTFTAIFKLFGSTKVVPPGYYDEYFYYGELIQTNIYTIYRGLITDFGFAGSIIFMIALGFFLHAAFWKMLTSKRSEFSVAVFVHSIGFFYMSTLISIFIWNTTYASFILLWIILLINRKIYILR